MSPCKGVEEYVWDFMAAFREELQEKDGRSILIDFLKWFARQPGADDLLASLETPAMHSGMGKVMDAKAKLKRQRDNWKARALKMHGALTEIAESCCECRANASDVANKALTEFEESKS